MPPPQQQQLLRAYDLPMEGVESRGGGWRDYDPSNPTRLVRGDVLGVRFHSNRTTTGEGGSHKDLRVHTGQGLVDVLEKLRERDLLDKVPWSGGRDVESLWAGSSTPWMVLSFLGRLQVSRARLFSLLLKICRSALTESSEVSSPLLRVFRLVETLGEPRQDSLSLVELEGLLESSAELESLLRGTGYARGDPRHNQERMARDLLATVRYAFAGKREKLASALALACHTADAQVALAGGLLQETPGARVKRFRKAWCSWLRAEVSLSELLLLIAEGSPETTR